MFIPDFYIYNLTEMNTQKVFERTTETIKFFPNKTIR